MAKDTISQYSKTAGSNTDIQSVDIAESCSPANINDAIRELMADLAALCDGTQSLNALDINGGELVLDADGDTSITADTDDQIDFKVAGSDAVTIDASGDVGIGIAAPDGKLHAQSATAGTVTADADADELVLENSSSTGMSILSPSEGKSTIYFGNPGTNGQKDGGIKYWHESHATTANRRSLTFHTGGDAEGLRIGSSGEVTKPLQPCVLVNPNATQTNFAVNTDVTIVGGTEVFDIGGNFASNTFTAPVTGKYLVSYSVRLENLDSASAYYYIGLFASNRQYYPILSSDRFSADVPYWSCTGSITIDMDASDTFYMIARQNNGTAQSDIAPNASSYLSIVLVA